MTSSNSLGFLWLNDFLAKLVTSDKPAGRHTETRNTESLEKNEITNLHRRLNATKNRLWLLVRKIITNNQLANATKNRLRFSVNDQIMCTISNAIFQNMASTIILEV